MLRECADVKQHPGEGHRRWFVDPDFELIVWYGDTAEPGAITGFQLCYDRRVNAEHALTWRRTGASTHSKVDGGDTPLSRRTPLLVPDGPIPAVVLRDRFAAAAREIDPSVAALVQGVLDDLASQALAPAGDAEH